VKTYALAFQGEIPAGVIDGSVLRPDTLCAKALVDVCATKIRCGSTDYEIGEVYDVTESPSSPSPQLRVEGAASYSGLGRAMAESKLVIDGPGGDLVGHEMTGGEIEVHGDAGDRAGAGMRGGLLRIEGRAGDELGGPAPGASRGMNGGEIVVASSAGSRAGFKMRRGLIWVGEEVGRDAALHMLAGTVVAASGDLERAGLGMKRGTIVALAAKPEPLTSFREDGITRAVFLRLLWRRLDALGLPLAHAEAFDAALFRSFSGDLTTTGRGEILYRVP